MQGGGGGWPPNNFGRESPFDRNAPGGFDRNSTGPGGRQDYGRPSYNQGPPQQFGGAPV